MKLLTLCLGNICRSPLAEGILKAKLPNYFIIDSAGTAAYHEGGKADERSIQIAKNHGITINEHRARKILLSDLDDFDIIFCMDASNFANALQICQNDKQKSKLVMINPDGSDVPDPYYGGIQDFEDVYTLLEKSIEFQIEKYQFNKNPK